MIMIIIIIITEVQNRLSKVITRNHQNNLLPSGENEMLGPLENVKNVRCSYKQMK